MLAFFRVVETRTPRLLNNWSVHSITCRSLQGSVSSLDRAQAVRSDLRLLYWRGCEKELGLNAGVRTGKGWIDALVLTASPICLAGGHASTRGREGHRFSCCWGAAPLRGVSVVNSVQSLEAEPKLTRPTPKSIMSLCATSRVSCDSLAPSSADFSAWRSVFDGILDAQQSPASMQSAVDTWRHSLPPGWQSVTVPWFVHETDANHGRATYTFYEAASQNPVAVARALHPSERPCHIRASPCRCFVLCLAGRRDVNALSRAVSFPRLSGPYQRRLSCA